jgi:hypothetical protein
LSPYEMSSLLECANPRLCPISGEEEEEIQKEHVYTVRYSENQRNQK